MNKLLKHPILQTNRRGEIDMKPLSPLRYPGGKSRAVKVLSKYIPFETKEICSPFFGGGSFELDCAKNGIIVYGYDLFNPLVEFWQCVKNNPEKLSNVIQQHHPLSKEKFYQLQKNQSSSKSKYERAARFFVLNRSSFSGSTLSGGMSPNHPRFNQSSIERVKQFGVKNFSVKRMGFEQSIFKHTNTLLYLDPPYLIDSYLYGNKGNTHRGFDHRGLFEILNKRGKWILSYNNCEEIIEMYSEYDTYYPEWSYGMSSDKSSKEVLILSKDIEK